MYVGCMDVCSRCADLYFGKDFTWFYMLQNGKTVPFLRPRKGAVDTQNAQIPCLLLYICARKRGVLGHVRVRGGARGARAPVGGQWSSGFPAGWRGAHPRRRRGAGLRARGVSTRKIPGCSGRPGHGIWEFWASGAWDFGSFCKNSTCFYMLQNEKTVPFLRPRKGAPDAQNAQIPCLLVYICARKRGVLGHLRRRGGVRGARAPVGGP